MGMRSQQIPLRKAHVSFSTHALSSLPVVLNSGYILGSLGAFKHRCLSPTSNELNQNLQQWVPKTNIYISPNIYISFSIYIYIYILIYIYIRLWRWFYLQSARIGNHYATLLLSFEITKWVFKCVSCKWLSLQYKCLLLPHCNYSQEGFYSFSLLGIF